MTAAFAQGKKSDNDTSAFLKSSEFLNWKRLEQLHLFYSQLHAAADALSSLGTIKKKKRLDLIKKTLCGWIQARKPAIQFSSQ